MGSLDSSLPAATVAAPPAPRRKRFYANLWVQVLVAIALAVLLGHFSPAKAIAMKPLGDAFIRLITMVITLIIFCTVVSGIAGVQDNRHSIPCDGLHATLVSGAASCWW
jgi:aerobic C4-dicarboxylate transport protein